VQEDLISSETPQEQIVRELQRSNRIQMATRADIRALRRLIFTMIPGHARENNLPSEEDNV
jgi:hypothetical protein